MEKRAGFVKADGFCVWENVQSDFEGNAAVEKLIFGGPGVVHSAVVSFLGARIRGEKHGRDVVGLARVGKREQRPRTRNHAMALVLAVGSVADFFDKSVIRVLERA